MKSKKGSIALFSCKALFVFIVFLSLLCAVFLLQTNDTEEGLSKKGVVSAKPRAVA